jgi:hypothetical protein
MQPFYYEFASVVKALLIGKPQNTSTRNVMVNLLMSPLRCRFAVSLAMP